jgi:tetratricopeptide (TPR) repeat protein
VKLEPDLAEAHLALAELGMYATFNYDQAEQHFKYALQLNPYLSTAHYHYAWLLFLLGRKDEAVVEHEFAQQFDPFNPIIVGHGGLLYTYLDRHDIALREIGKSFEIQKACPDGYYALVELYLIQGRINQAIETCKEFVESDPIWKWVLGYVYASTGHRKEAKQILYDLLNENINSWNALGITGIFGNLGEMEEAFKWMGYEPHHAWVPWLTVMPMGKPFWKEDRFAEFRRKWNLSNI